MRMNCTLCGSSGNLYPEKPIIQDHPVLTVKCGNIHCGNIWDGSADKEDEKYQVYKSTGKEPDHK